MKNHSNLFRNVCHPSSGSTELCFTEITLSGSQIFFVCLVGVWQLNFEPVVCVCARYRHCKRFCLLITVVFDC